jgi:hypothetical protein
MSGLSVRISACKDFLIRSLSLKGAIHSLKALIRHKIGSLQWDAFVPAFRLGADDRSIYGVRVFPDHLESLSSQVVEDAAFEKHFHPSVDDVVVHEPRDFKKAHLEACAVKKVGRRITTRSKVFPHIRQTSANHDANRQVAAEYFADPLRQLDLP